MKKKKSNRLKKSGMGLGAAVSMGLLLAGVAIKPAAQGQDWLEIMESTDFQLQRETKQDFRKDSIDDGAHFIGNFQEFSAATSTPSYPPFS